tara:strand:- start:44 stop:775 length:732 start_codon:yes stop_codon:yes gene_type:complete
MKHILNKVIRNVKSIKGSSLAEFATTTALMATLAATAAPKLSEMAEGSKQEKTMNEIDKIIQQGQQFYQDTADLEGRGRFPGQGRFDMVVGGGTGIHGTRSTTNDTTLRNSQNRDIEGDLFGTYTAGNDPEWSGGLYNHFEAADRSIAWVSVFGLSSEAKKPVNHGLQDDDQPDTDSDEHDKNGGHADWLTAFGGETMDSPYQDGHYIYRVVPGYGSGNTVVPPILYVADIENPANFNAVLMP